MKSYLQKHNKITYSDNWSTPKEIYIYYVYENDYQDPCALYSEETNLKDNLFGNQTLINEKMFVNPPYSNINEWVEWCLLNHKKYSKHIVMLIPSRTDTKYFHDLLKYGVDLEFIKGRLKFGNAKQGAPFPSVLVHLNEN